MACSRVTFFLYLSKCLPLWPQKTWNFIRYPWCADLILRVTPLPWMNYQNPTECTYVVGLQQICFASNLFGLRRPFAGTAIVKWRLRDVSKGDVNIGRFVMISLFTNSDNKKTKGPTLMELFTATRKLIFFFWQLEMFDVCTTGDTAHIDTIFKLLPHTNLLLWFLVINICNHGEHYETPCIEWEKKQSVTVWPGCRLLDFCASLVGHTDGEGHKKIITFNYIIELKKCK